MILGGDLGDRGDCSFLGLCFKCNLFWRCLISFSLSSLIYCSSASLSWLLTIKSELMSIVLTLSYPSSMFLSFCNKLRKSYLTLSSSRIFLSLIRWIMSYLSLYYVLLILYLTSESNDRHLLCRCSILKYTSFNSSSRVYMY